jgi:hypothetical protein
MQPAFGADILGAGGESVVLPARRATLKAFVC